MEDGYYTTATAIILAGGKSERMGENKSLLEIDSIPMIDYIRKQLSRVFFKILISANNVPTYSFLQLPIIPDNKPGIGPLMAILSTLEASLSNLNFVISCDIPDFDTEFIKEMLSQAILYDAVVPRFSDNRIEPLFAVYNKNSIHFIKKALNQGETRVSSFYKDINVKYMDMKGRDWYTNINTREDYASYLKKRYIDAIK